MGTPNTNALTAQGANDVQANGEKYENFDFRNSTCIKTMPLCEIPLSYRYCAYSSGKKTGKRCFYLVIFKEYLGALFESNMAAWVGKSLRNDKGEATPETIKAIREMKDPHLFLRIFQETANPEKLCAIIVKSKWERC